MRGPALPGRCCSVLPGRCCYVLPGQCGYLRKSGTSRSSASSKVTVCGGRWTGWTAGLGPSAAPEPDPTGAATGTGSASSRAGCPTGREVPECEPLADAPLVAPLVAPWLEAPFVAVGRPAWIVAEGPVVAALDRAAAVEPGRDDGDPHLVAEGVVDDRAEDDVGLGVRGLLDQPGRLVDLEQAEVGAALDRQQHAVGAVDAGLEQRARRSPARRPGPRGPRRGRSRCP